MAGANDRPSRIRRAVVVAIAAATLGAGGAMAVASGQDDPAPVSCGPTAADLQRAADAARALEAERPDLFGPGSVRADAADLRLAAEWARRLESLHPIEGC